MEVPRSTGASPIQGAPSPAPGEENDGDTAVPSFRDAFSDALLTASHSVMAAARGMTLSNTANEHSPKACMCLSGTQEESYHPVMA